MRIALIVSLLIAGAAAVYFDKVPQPVSDWIRARWSSISVAGTAPAAVERSAALVKVAAVRVETVPIFLNAIGTVQAYNSVNVRSRVDGEITQILFHEGQDVRQGDVLATIDPRPLQAQLAQQEAVRRKDQALLDGAVVDMQRYDRLLTQDSISHQQADQQRALVDQYRAQVRTDDALIDYARTQLEFTSIRAPFSGRVGIRQLDQGNFVHSVDNTTIVTLTQLQPISVIFTVSAAALSETNLTPGQAHVPVVAIGQDEKTELDRGTIDLVDTQVDATTGTIKLKASFPNASLKLWPGNFVNGRITVDERKNAVTVPSVGIRHGPRSDFVWVVKPDNTVAPRNITAGQAFDGRTLIEKGLGKEAKIVVEGYYRLDNGMKVEIQQQAKPGAPDGSS